MLANQSHQVKTHRRQSYNGLGECGHPGRYALAFARLRPSAPAWAPASQPVPAPRVGCPWPPAACGLWSRALQGAGASGYRT
jgi:hypothetical protein